MDFEAAAAFLATFRSARSSFLLFGRLLSPIFAASRLELADTALVGLFSFFASMVEEEDSSRRRFRTFVMVDFSLKYEW